jgi:hypothetical protein
MERAQALPTDLYGKIIHPIVDSSGNLLPTDTTGRHVNSRNEPIPLDEMSRPLGPDNQLLEKNQNEQYVYKDLPLKPTVASGKPIIVVNAQNEPLPTNSAGYYIMRDGSPVPTNVDLQYVGADSSPLPVDEHARVVIGARDDLDQGKTLPTDSIGKEIHQIVRPDGSLLSTDSTNRYVNDQGEPIQLDDFGKPLDPDGYPLPTNAYNQFIYPSEPEKTTAYPVVVGPDGLPLQKDREGNFIKPDGSLVERGPGDKGFVSSDGLPLPVAFFSCRFKASYTFRQTVLDSMSLEKMKLNDYQPINPGSSSIPSLTLKESFCRPTQQPIDTSMLKTN